MVFGTDELAVGLRLSLRLDELKGVQHLHAPHAVERRVDVCNEGVGHTRGVQPRGGPEKWGSRGEL